MKFDIESYEMNLGKDKKKPKKYIDRDISWIDFNYRVLSCSLKKSTPLNERMNFLGITESNLDEFISVRFSNMNNDKDHTPYKKLLKRIKKFKQNQNAAFEMIESDIKHEYGYEFTNIHKLKKSEYNEVKDFYYKELFPRITPFNMVDNDINLVSGMNYIATIIERDSYEKLVVIPILKDFKPFYIVNKNIVLTENIIMEFLRKTVFVNQNIKTVGCFKIIRDGSVELSHDQNKFIVDRMEDSIHKRDTGKVIFLEVSNKTDESLVHRLTSLFHVPSNHVISNIINNYKIFSYKKIFEEKESYKKFVPFDYDNNKNYYDMFEALDNEDILLHHPYDSYDTVLRFIQHSATDENVESIKMTLYRVSGINSPIVNALCEAAYNGKFVVALVEIKARFDEDNNIRIINKLKNSGVNVILGNEFLKTHCKMCIVTRKTDDGVKIYSHVATGNYNEKTAKIYTDLSFLTSKNKIGIDLLNIFNIISGYSRPDDDLSKVFYSPVNLRKKLVKCIDREIEYAKKGKKAGIFIKVNSLSDSTMIDKLYQAANAGVKIEIIARAPAAARS